jgi:uncharacterized protein (DUF1697 family)
MMGKFVALLRGINVAGSNRIAMADLRQCCRSLGWSEVATYIQSGNAVFSARGSAAGLEAGLEQAMASSLGLTVPVIVRAAADWSTLVAGNPFPEAAEKEPNRLMLLVAKRPPAASAAEAIRDRASAGERVARCGEAIWIHYPEGAGRSRLSPSLIDRLVGSPTTARNYRTAVKLNEILRD